MICERCRGRGFVVIDDQGPRLAVVEPCPECQGSGIVSCCDAAGSPTHEEEPMTKNDCCLCGLPYERIGNNPAPLSLKGRCCDACNEVVIMARIDPTRLGEEIKRVAAALERTEDAYHWEEAAIAAICASRGPVLLAEKQRVMDELMKEL